MLLIDVLVVRFSGKNIIIKNLEYKKHKDINSNQMRPLC